MTFLLILIGARKAAQMLVLAQQKQWNQQTGFELQGKTLGLIGSGSIAQHVAHIGSGFGMEVVYWSRSGEKADMAGQYKDFDFLLAESDVLSLHVPAEAGEIIGKSALSKLQPQAILINTSPAKLVNADALYEALKNNKLSAAGFDPFYSEGKGAWDCVEAELFTLGADKFFMTPHDGWNTKEANDNMFRKAIEYIQNAE